MVPSLAAGGGSRGPVFFPSSTEVQGICPARVGAIPLRRSGIMVTRSLFGFKAQGKGSWCGRRDLNLTGLAAQRFSYPSTAFAAPVVQSLGSGLSLHRVPDSWLSGAARLDPLGGQHVH